MLITYHIQSHVKYLDQLFSTYKWEDHNFPELVPAEYKMAPRTNQVSATTSHTFGEDVRFIHRNNEKICLQDRFHASSKPHKSPLCLFHDINLCQQANCITTSTQWNVLVLRVWWNWINTAVVNKILVLIQHGWTVPVPMRMSILIRNTADHYNFPLSNKTKRKETKQKIAQWYKNEQHSAIFWKHKLHVKVIMFPCISACK